MHTSRGYLNDPNGPVELEGTTHLYFQSRPYPHKDVPVEWGHASTTDLINWRLHRPAMSPLPGARDADGCWSGNALVDGSEVHAYYSGKTAGDTYQSVLRAVSTDGGASFGPPRQVLADPLPDEQVTMFRDPFVYREDDALTMMVGAARADGSGAIRRYRSTDGISWAYTGDVAGRVRGIVGGEDTGEGWECPQILPTDAGEIALISSWSFADGVGHVLSFPVGGDAPVVPVPQRVDHGTSFYAASVMREHSSGSPVLWGWIREARSTVAWQDAGWAGAISLPRTAWCAADGSLRTAPHPAVDALRIDTGRPADGARIDGRAEIVVPEGGGAVRIDFGADEYCTIDIDPDAGIVTLDRSHAAGVDPLDGSRSVAPDAFDASGRPAVRIFVDGSILEIFTSAGRSVTSRVYPRSAPEWTVHAPAGAVLFDIRRSIEAESTR
ncbi:glycosyl hydrolase family 32 [Microbacterium suwonense]|uniref:beta-fructofuranosidase n=1 Tax=Microbacterium suwonense TaxID=683047 RepID=A0ABN6X5Y3_9MICO|nr:glycosyl hydrolase family 32 [Microbacterium suwonense]